MLDIPKTEETFATKRVVCICDNLKQCEVKVKIKLKLRFNQTLNLKGETARTVPAGIYQLKVNIETQEQGVKYLQS